MAESCNKFLFRVLLPDGHNLTLELENADEKMSVAEFVHIVRRQAEKQPLENRFRKIHWGPQVHIQDNGGKRIEDGKIICQDSRNKVKVIFLQDGDINSVHMHQNTWNVTPEPQLLGERPQDYTFQTASANLIDNSLQLRVNGSGEKRFIRGTMNSSKAMRGSVIGLKPPCLKNTWNVTPEPQPLVERPQDYTFQTASADLFDNSLQLWANGPGERRLIRGTMNSSNHRAMRGSITRLRPSYLKKWEDEWKLHGSKVEKHEYELRKLQTNKSEVNKSLSDFKRELNQCTFSSKMVGKGMPNQSSHTVEDTLEEIKRQGTTAASLWLDLSRRCVQSIQSPIIQDVIGVVALLGKVEDDVLSRALSEYLGRENMLALVCKSRVGAEALEHYDHSGNIVTYRGLHGLASAQKAKINGRFRVICLEDIRSYEGGFKVGDPQKQLIIEDPKSSDGILPEGYMGYAVNMIKLDHEELCPSTSSGIGLRGTLFFNLFSYLQVYKTRNHMKQATSYITDGAVSLDGAMLRRKGVTECGNRDKVSVKFPTTSAKTLHSTSAKTMSSFFHLRADIEEKIVKKKEEKKMLEKQIRRTRYKLKCLKNFENKKKELEEREARKNMFLENCQQRGLLLENHEQSDKIIAF